MTEPTVSELLARIEAGWNDLNTFIASLSEQQLTEPTDAAGWTVKDHLAHLVVWEASAEALLRRQPRWEAMGISEALWDTHDVDTVNAAMQQQHKDRPLADVLVTLRAGHDRLVAYLQTRTDEDLQRTYAYYQPGQEGDAPIIDWVRGNTFEHYAEHIPWMQAIAEQPPLEPTISELLARIEAGWNALNAFVDSLDEAQLTGPTDAAGWTVKDHLVHISDWEISVYGLLQGKPRWESMRLSADEWNIPDLDRINDIMQKRSQGLALAEARQHVDATHAALVARIAALNDADLMRPYKDFDKESTRRDPILAFIVGNSFGHYAEHIPWMRAIVEQA